MGGLLGPVHTGLLQAKSAFSAKENTFGVGFHLLRPTTTTTKTLQEEDPHLLRPTRTHQDPHLLRPTTTKTHQEEDPHPLLPITTTKTLQEEDPHHPHQDPPPLLLPPTRDPHPQDHLRPRDHRQDGRLHLPKKSQRLELVQKIQHKLYFLTLKINSFLTRWEKEEKGTGGPREEEEEEKGTGTILRHRALRRGRRRRFHHRRHHRRHLRRRRSRLRPGDPRGGEGEEEEEEGRRAGEAGAGEASAAGPRGPRPPPRTRRRRRRRRRTGTRTRTGPGARGEKTEEKGLEEPVEGPESQSQSPAGPRGRPAQRSSR